MNIIGRVAEQAELVHFRDSGRPEFIVVYGRRRIGKTFLVKQFFKEEFAFYFTGVVGEHVAREDTLRNFDDAVKRYGGAVDNPSKDWQAAFGKLRVLVESLPRDRRQIIFIDEMPWLDVSGSGFLAAFDYFWNSFASARPEILLIACGSATSWVVKNLFHNRGGLHNRLTGRIHLAPFTLGECEKYFGDKNIVMSRYQILESYLVFGGVPYYLDSFRQGLGPTQNIDNALFAEFAPLRDEFDEVYHSLFKEAQQHLDIIEALAGRLSGMTRDEIALTTGIPSGGYLSKCLQELEQSSFIGKFSDFTRPKNGAYYRIADPFSLFYLRFVRDNNSKDEYFWTNTSDDGKRRAWSGYAFELACLQHLPQIKRRLGIAGVSTTATSWRSKTNNPGAQIDLLIDRKDGVINLCEIKCTQHPITIDKALAEGLQRRQMVFLEETGCRKAIHPTMITTYGITNKGYRSAIQAEVVLDDLFE